MASCVAWRCGAGKGQGLFYATNTRVARVLVEKSKKKLPGRSGAAKTRDPWEKPIPACPLRPAKQPTP
jgi:hypothetical protein